MTASKLTKICLALSLLGGAVVNGSAAKEFIFSPIKQASSLGLEIVPGDGPQSEISQKVLHNVIVLLNLTGVVLAVLAVFYLMVAIAVVGVIFKNSGPSSYVDNVVFAIFARLCGAAYYVAVLMYYGGPSEFNKFLVLNVALAILHALFLGRDGWRCFFRLKSSS